MKHTILDKELNRLQKLCFQENQTGVEIENFHLGALSALLSCFPDTTLVLCPPDLVPLLLEMVQPSWERNKGLFFPSNTEDENTPDGFQSQNDRHLKQALSLIISMPEKIRFIITTENGLSNPVFPPNKPSSFLINPQSAYDQLLDWLINNGYERTDMVTTPGSYSVRGSIIDLFSYSADTAARVNFIDEQGTGLFLIDIDTQLTTESVSEYPVTPVVKELGHRTLKDLFSDNLLCFQILDSHHIVIGSDQNPIVTQFRLRPVQPHVFGQELKENPILKFELSHDLQSTGYRSPENEYVMPSWFMETKPEDAEIPLKFQSPELDLFDIASGDYVVHRDHGIGIFRGLKTEEGSDSIQEFLILEYQDGGIIYVSSEKLNRLSFYASSHESGIHPDSLSKTAQWKQKKERARKQAEEIVESLVLLYAERSQVTRPPYEVDEGIEQVFLSEFPYDDTEDQKLVWKDISRDLSKSHPMNRLLCGDVGFGKTEIAIRAAFRVVFGGKQVAVLAPTTILADQLYAAFKSRLEEYTISVDVLSRFRTAAEARTVKEEISRGFVDVAVGTHALLADTVSFKNLGLLIIDEEHRFGVKQKEKIQELQKSVDVLSMSATPIPRTLHMSFAGVRNISTLFTPPKARLPISTQISYWDKNLIQKAVRFEISRGGQVFFVHNNVKTINEITDILRDILPDLKISYVHGQESARSLEKSMLLFLKRKIDVLVCTSIIETGLDIQNANTIIINRAHHFGLSQLYQIRGRVGRSNRLAYSYLLIPKGIKLKKDAYRRLKAIEENTSLGSGYNISKLDLEIRGAGTLFGYKQSGGVGRVGFELYAQFINDAIHKKMKGDQPEPFLKPDQVNIRLFADCTIPVEYISTNNLRLGFYRRLAMTENTSDVNRIEYEMTNRFGLPPLSVQNLLLTTRFRILCALSGICKIAREKDNLVFIFDQRVFTHGVDTLFSQVQKLFQETRQNYWFKERKGVGLALTVGGIWYEDIPNFTVHFLEQLEFFPTTKKA